MQTIEAVAKTTGLPVTTVNTALDGFITVTQKALKKGEEISLTGFGKYYVSRSKARKGINPKTQEPLRIPARNVVRFKAGQTLKNALN